MEILGAVVQKIVDIIPSLSILINRRMIDVQLGKEYRTFHSETCVIDGDKSFKLVDRSNNFVEGIFVWKKDVRVTNLSKEGIYIEHIQITKPNANMGIEGYDNMRTYLEQGKSLDFTLQAQLNAKVDILQVEEFLKHIPLGVKTVEMEIEWTFLFLTCHPTRSKTIVITIDKK